MEGAEQVNAPILRPRVDHSDHLGAVLLHGQLKRVEAHAALGKRCICPRCEKAPHNVDVPLPGGKVQRSPDVTITATSDVYRSPGREQHLDAPELSKPGGEVQRMQ